MSSAALASPLGSAVDVAVSSRGLIGDVDKEKNRRLSNASSFLSIGNLIAKESNRDREGDASEHSAMPFLRKEEGNRNTRILGHVQADKIERTGENQGISSSSQPESTKTSDVIHSNASSPLQSPIPKYPSGFSAFSPAGRLLSLLPAEHPYQILLRREWEQMRSTPLDIFAEQPHNTLSESNSRTVDSFHRSRSNSQSESRSGSPKIDVDSSPIRINSSPIVRDSGMPEDLIERQNNPDIAMKMSTISSHDLGCMPKQKPHRSPLYDSETNQLKGNSNSDWESESRGYPEDTQDNELQTNHQFHKKSKMQEACNVPNEEIDIFINAEKKSSQSPTDLSSFPRFYFNPKFHHRDSPNAKVTAGISNWKARIGDQIKSQGHRTSSRGEGTLIRSFWFQRALINIACI